MGFNTSCTGISNLNGTCEISGSSCNSYNSTNLGAASKITNSGTGSNLNFKVEFTLPSPPNPPNTKLKYKVTASPSGNNYDGSAEVDTGMEGDPIDPVDPDPWVATATQVEPAYQAKAGN